MRRGLKREVDQRCYLCDGCFKPIPDEEGTETKNAGPGRSRDRRARFKPIPDEEGTETMLQTVTQLTAAQSFKPIPDEEGTETPIPRAKNL